MNAAAARVNALRNLRAAASRFQPSSLPQVTRGFSASARRSYEYIEVSEPRPGVGQGKNYITLDSFVYFCFVESRKN
jgi:enoyl-CoA hydratase